MQDYKRGSHTIWDCKYHIVWVTKYRYPILVGDVGERARELLREIARANEMTIYAGAINRELCRILGDGVSQAADLISDATSIPSLNFTPLMTFGN
jgi:hypothetical protein